MEDALLDAFDGRSGRRHGNLGRVAQHLIRERRDGARHRCGKQQRLPLLRKLRDDFSNVVDEAHIEHPVGFIEHEKFHLAEAQPVAGHEVEQASGRGDEHVDAVLHRAHLRAHGHAADHQGGPGADMAAVSAEAIEYLPGQLACRAQHQYTAGLALRAPPICEEMMQDRHRECRGLAGASLRNPDHVAARQNNGNGLRLDRRGRSVFFFSERACDRFGKAEIMKRGQ